MRVHELLRLEYDAVTENAPVADRHIGSEFCKFDFYFAFESVDGENQLQSVNLAPHRWMEHVVNLLQNLEHNN